MKRSRRIEVSFLAESDLDNIAAYIRRDSPRHAARMLAAFAGKFRVIGRNLDAYRVRQEIAAELRVATLGRYLILFRILENAVRVERVVAGERDLFALLQEAE